MPMDKWDACGIVSDPMQWRTEMLMRLEGEQCYAGLDLANTTDIAALCLWFPDHGIAIPFFWVPSDNAEKRERRDRVPYLTWARQGWIEATSDNSIDYDVIRNRINELGNRFRFMGLAIDRWNATQLATQLMGDGFPVVMFGQGYASMSAPTKHLETLIINKQVQHGSNPVLRWNVSNAATETDAAANIKLSKRKSSEKIDGAIALVMAVGISTQPGEMPLTFYTANEVEWG